MGAVVEGDRMIRVAGHVNTTYGGTIVVELDGAVAIS